jgi:hypothetical protein
LGEIYGLTGFLRVVGPLIGLSLPAIFVCPIAMAVAVIRLKTRSVSFRLGVFVGDCCLSLFQLWTLIPTIQ